MAAPGRSDKSTWNKKKSKTRPLPYICAMVGSVDDHHLKGAAKDSNAESESVAAQS